MERSLKESKVVRIAKSVQVKLEERKVGNMQARSTGAVFLRFHACTYERKFIHDSGDSLVDTL